MGQKGEGGYKLLAEADVFDGASSSSSINTKCIWRKSRRGPFRWTEGVQEVVVYRDSLLLIGYKII